MDRGITARRTDSSHITVRNVAGVLSCLLAFFPCLFSSLNGRVGTGVILVIYVLAILLAIYSINPRMVLKIQKWQTSPLILWGIVLLICILNNNGDIRHFSYLSILHLIFIIAYSILLVAQSEFLCRSLLRVIALYLIIQFIFGIFFLAYPNVLLRIGPRLFSMSSSSSSKFTRFVNNGLFMGLTSHVSTAGMYMALAVVLATTFLLVYWNRFSRWNVWYIVALVGSLAALLLTQKRGPLMFSVAAIILMYLAGFVKGNLNRRLMLIIVLIIIFIVVVLIAWQIPAAQRIMLDFFSGDSLDDVSSHRIDELWTPAIREFLDQPLRGMGWMQFRYQHVMSNGGSNNVHNIYLQLLAENGFIMGGYIIALIGWTYVSSWRLLLKMKYHVTRNEYLYLMFAFGYQTFFILYGLTGNPLYDVQCLFPFMASCGITYMCMAKYRSDLKAGRALSFVVRR